MAGISPDEKTQITLKETLLPFAIAIAIAIAVVVLSAGDEDGGGMSAFVVFWMMGFYPVTPGVPVYNLASPVFDGITIKLHNGKTLEIVCQNNSKDNKYIQSIRLNGKPLNQVWFRHADIVNGGTLELQMGNTPNEKLGSDLASFPPSEMALRLSDFVTSR